MLSPKQIGTICFAIFAFISPLFATGVSSTASTAYCDNATLNTYTGTSNLQANWDANEIDLHWYADTDATIEMEVASASQGCTYDGTLTPPATIPTKTGYTFKGWTVRGLPDGYTRLEYIQSSGTQYINTGVQYNSSKPIVLILTAKSDYSTTSNHLALGFGGSAGQWFGLNSQKWTIGTGGVSTVLATNKTSNIEITWTGGKEYLKIAGVSIGSRSTTNTTNNLCLFGYQGQTSSMFRGTIYSVQIFVDNVLVKDFIPAKNSSNVVGMYDTVSKTFFTNVGTGSFTAGAVVE